MKAVVFRRYGGPELLSVEDHPDPVPAAGEVKRPLPSSRAAKSRV